MSDPSDDARKAIIAELAGRERAELNRVLNEPDSIVLKFLRFHLLTENNLERIVAARLERGVFRKKPVEAELSPQALRNTPPNTQKILPRPRAYGQDSQCETSKKENAAKQDCKFGTSPLSFATLTLFVGFLNMTSNPDYFFFITIPPRVHSGVAFVPES